METNAFTFLKEYKPLVSNKDVVYFSFFLKKKKRLLEPLFLANCYFTITWIVLLRMCSECENLLPSESMRPYNFKKLPANDDLSII